MSRPAIQCKRCGAPLVVPAGAGRRPLYCSVACRKVVYRRRKGRSVHFKSDSCEWSTPQDFFDELNAEFRFTLDVCATAVNAKCPRFCTRDQDGLAQPWTGRVWCNPPYGKGVGRWVATAWRATRSGEAEVAVVLIHARTDTRWWHEWAQRADEIRYVKGRLTFGGPNRAPFPSALLVFRPAFRPAPARDEMRDEIRPE